MRELNTRDSVLRLLFAFFLASMLAPSSVHAMALAYIDPLSGSVLLQVIVAGVLGAIFSTKTFLAKVRGAARSAWSKLSRK